MKKVLLDTNIILDFALERKYYFSDAEKILKLAFEGKITTYITATTVTDIYYISRKEKGKDQTIGFLRNLMEFVEVANVNKNVILEAFALDFNDFEDAIQESAAQHSNISKIVTRNEKDFKNSSLEIFTPKDFLARNIT
ncbi:PIN domain-containing protein [candidate division KSB1 bacterium]|nr:PIN domain-containing protein [candidate division KSB1 bacterium]